MALPYGVFGRLMAINGEAFHGGNYSVGYHALAAALHCAQDAQDEAGLLTVARVGREQRDWIDRRAPDYEHSTPSATRRGNTNIFTLLVRQAETQARIVAHSHGPAPGRREEREEPREAIAY